MNLLAALGFPHRRKNPKSIWLGRRGGMGDIVLTTPTVAALKAKHPNAKITYNTRRGICQDIIANDPNIDQFDFCERRCLRPKRRGGINVVKRLLSFIANTLILNLKYDMVVFFIIERKDIDYNKHVVDHFAESAGILLKQDTRLR